MEVKKAEIRFRKQTFYQDYQNTIIARDDRDYVWIMSRQKRIDQDTLKILVKKIEDDGYDIKKIRWIEHSN